MSVDLPALFEQHKTAVLGVAAAGVAGLALMQRRKAGGSPAAAVPGTIPAAAVVPSGGGSAGGAYDSSSYDVYNALQPTLEQILQTTTRSGITSAPDAVASHLFSPTYDGQYVQAGKNNGGMGPGIFEVEGDGSLLHLTQEQWDTAITKAGLTPNTPAAGGLFSKLSAGWNGNWYNTDTNIGSASTGKTAAPVTLDPSTGKVIPAKTAG